MTTKRKHTIESVQCYPVDMAKLNKAVNESVHKGKLDNFTYSVHGRHALIKTPITAIIEEDFVGSEISKSVTWWVYKAETCKDGSMLCDCVPTYEATIILKELENYLGEPTTLAEFTKGRRGYNARIKVNERLWLAAFNKER